MALISRITRLFRADAHAVLDRLEEPDVLLGQAVREMEEALARNEQRLRLITHEEQRIRVRISDTEAMLSRAEDEMDVCFSAGKEDLARAVVRRRLEAERLAESLSRRRDELTATLAGLQRRVEENRSQLEGMRQKAELYATEEAAGEGNDWRTPDLSVGDDEVEVAFLREKQRRQPS